jgi:GNAT superfamily N-acetyltransferase
MSDAFFIEPLGGHDRSCFSSGVIPLDRYLREQASQNVKRQIASCFVAVDTATGAIAGYYTLAATSVQASDLPPDILKRLPRYASLPAALVGRLAIDQRFQRRRLGSALLTDAALRVIKGDLKAFATTTPLRSIGTRDFCRMPAVRVLSFCRSRPPERGRRVSDRQWCMRGRRAFTSCFRREDTRESRF